MVVQIFPHSLLGALSGYAYGHNSRHFPFFFYLYITNPLPHKVLAPKSEGTVSL